MDIEDDVLNGLAGDIIRYWEFFPAEGQDSNRMGVIPVWGFADVVESKARLFVLWASIGFA